MWTVNQKVRKEQHFLLAINGNKSKNAEQIANNVNLACCPIGHSWFDLYSSF